MQPLEQLARDIAAVAIPHGERLVLAESCTAGLAAHALSLVPGASAWFCGSAVVYRNETKSAWLGVPEGQLDDPAIGPVSPQTAAALCRGVLTTTPEATLAASVTGHLGPGAPQELDGCVYLGVQHRGDATARVESRRLASRLPEGSPLGTLRLHRQYEAAAHLLRLVHEALAARG